MGVMVYVNAADFLQAAADATPSISEDDLREYEALERAFDDRVGGTLVNTSTSSDTHSCRTSENIGDHKISNGANNEPLTLLPLQEIASSGRSLNKLRDNHDQIYL